MISSQTTCTQASRFYNKKVIAFFVWTNFGFKIWPPMLFRRRGLVEIWANSNRILNHLHARTWNFVTFLERTFARVFFSAWFHSKWSWGDRFSTLFSLFFAFGTSLWIAGTLLLPNLAKNVYLYYFRTLVIVFLRKLKWTRVPSA